MAWHGMAWHGRLRGRTVVDGRVATPYDDDDEDDDDDDHDGGASLRGE
jgi:hypothetical protein